MMSFAEIQYLLVSVGALVKPFKNSTFVAVVVLAFNAKKMKISSFSKADKKINLFWMLISF